MLMGILQAHMGAIGLMASPFPQYRQQEEAFEAASLLIILRLWRVVRIVNGEFATSFSASQIRKLNLAIECFTERA